MSRNPGKSHKCKGRKKNGSPCGSWAIRGSMVCAQHGGMAPQVRAKAKVRAELESWGLGETTLDPGEVLLRLLSQATWRAERYSLAISEQVERHGLHEALVGDRFVVDPNTGSLIKIDEFIRGLAQLENAERDRAAKFAEMAIKAGLAERQVRLAERQGLIIEKVLTRVFSEVGLTEEQQAMAPAIIRRALEAVA